ncbi:MAG TPA: DinB family protein [Cyclobacteriaceae bacterium]
MKTIFDKSTREELIDRINTLDENSKAQWGKMTIYQMVKHCRLWEEMSQGKITSKRVFIGRLFGKLALKMALKDDKPMGRNAPTSAELIVKEPNGDIIGEKKKWIALLGEYDHFSNLDFIHPFFGKMTKEQIGHHAYKHTDHHLRQFNS